MRLIHKNLLIFLLSVFSLSIYQINFGTFSLPLDRIITLILISFAVMVTLSRLRIEKIIFWYYLFLFYAIFLSFAAAGTLSSYGVMLIFSVLTLHATAHSAKYITLKKEHLIPPLVVAAIIFVFFNIYTLYTFFTTLRPPSNAPLEGMYTILTVKSGHIVEQGGFGLGLLTRAGLPFSRPQELGMTAAILLLLSYFVNEERKLKVIYFSMIIFTVTLLLAASRSAIFPLVSAGMITIAIFSPGALYKIIKPIVIWFPITIVIAALLDKQFLNAASEYINSFERLLQVFDGKSSQQHLSVRGLALQYSTSSNEQFLFGSGIGSFTKTSGISSAHSTYITLLHDVGFIGLSLFLLPLIQLGSRALRHASKNPVLFCVIIYIIQCHILYEIPNLTIFWIAQGLMLHFYSSHNYDSRGIHKSSKWQV